MFKKGNFFFQGNRYFRRWKNCFGSEQLGASHGDKKKYLGNGRRAAAYNNAPSLYSGNNETRPYTLQLRRDYRTLIKFVRGGDYFFIVRQTVGCALFQKRKRGEKVNFCSALYFLKATEERKFIFQCFHFSKLF